MQLLRNSDVIYVILIQFRLQNMTVCRHGGFLIICRKNSTDGKMVESSVGHNGVILFRKGDMLCNCYSCVSWPASTFFKSVSKSTLYALVIWLIISPTHRYRWSAFLDGVQIKENTLYYPMALLHINR